MAKARAARQAKRASKPNPVDIEPPKPESFEKFQTESIPLNMTPQGPAILIAPDPTRPTVDAPNMHPITKVPHAKMTSALEHTVARAADNLCNGSDVRLLRLVHDWIQAKGANYEWVAQVLNTTVEVAQKMFMEASILLQKGLLYGSYKAGQHVLQGKGRSSRRVYVPGTDDDFREKYYARAKALAAQQQQQKDIDFLQRSRSN